MKQHYDPFLMNGEQSWTALIMAWATILTVLSRIATPEQQKQMYSFMCEALAGRKYYELPIYENLFWSIILPEWLIAICMKQYSRSKNQIIDQIKKDEEDSFDANQINSFDLSLDL